MRSPWFLALPLALALTTRPSPSPSLKPQPQDPAPALAPSPSPSLHASRPTPHTPTTSPSSSSTSQPSAPAQALAPVPAATLGPSPNDPAAVAQGNHELYKNENIEYLARPGGFIESWQGGFLTANVLNATTRAPLGARSKLLVGRASGVRLLTFGFLYDMRDHADSVAVTAVAQVVGEPWLVSAGAGAELRVGAGAGTGAGSDLASPPPSSRRPTSRRPSGSRGSSAQSTKQTRTTPCSS